MSGKRERNVGRLLCILAVAPGFSCWSHALGEEVTVQNDSLSKGDLGNIQVGFVAGESAAAWLTSPCDGNIVAVQVFWRSFFGTEPPSLEDSIKIFDGGSFPFPGTLLEILEGPVMTDNVINEFRYLDENQTIPLIVPIANAQVFVVSFKFFNTPPPLGPSVVTDIDGCQAGKNAIDAQGLGWVSSCFLGVTGDFVIRAVVECGALGGACCELGGGCTDGATEDACTTSGGAFQGEGSNCVSITCEEACCFVPTGCLDLTVADCGIAGGFNQGPGTDCGTTECFPTGACCDPDGTCDDDVLELDCIGGGGAFQGSGSECATVECPPPDGACCLVSGGCLVLPEDDCGVIPDSTWAGALTDCSDGNGNDTADACEGGPPCDEDVECDDEDACTVDTCDTPPGGTCLNQREQRLFGDLVPSFCPPVCPQPDADDIICVLDDFRDGPSVDGCEGIEPPWSTDLAPCGGNGVLDLDDILVVLDAFTQVFACPHPCP